MSVRLTEIADVVRSKNSGPYELTLDVIFRSQTLFEKMKSADVLNASLVSRLYGLHSEETIKIVWFEPACAIKITFPRRIVSGNVGDTDIYGAQQHAPLLALEFEG
jgi:hypothetical protein